MNPFHVQIEIPAELLEPTPEEIERHKLGEEFTRAVGHSARLFKRRIGRENGFKTLPGVRIGIAAGGPGGGVGETTWIQGPPEDLTVPIEGEEGWEGG